MSLAHDRRGEGPPLVLLHGLGSSRSVWHPVLDDLAEDFDVIVVDLPGHGGSPPFTPGADATPAGLARLVTDLLDDLGLGRVHVVGNSLGGWVALELAAQGRALSVTALAPAGFWRDGIVPFIAHANRWAARVLAPVSPGLLRVRPFRAMGFWTASADAAALDPQVALEAVQAHAGARGWAAAIAGTHGRRCEVARQIPAEVPVTIAFGDADRILVPSACQERAFAPLHARWVTLAQCGHVPMWDQPDRTTELIRQTVAEAPPTAPPGPARRRAKPSPAKAS